MDNLRKRYDASFTAKVAFEAAKDEPFAIRIILWALGATLVAHIASFFSVRYFDQIIVFWYLLLVMISTASCLFKEEKS